MSSQPQNPLWNSLMSGLDGASKTPVKQPSNEKKSSSRAEEVAAAANEANLIVKKSLEMSSKTKKATNGEVKKNPIEEVPAKTTATAKGKDTNPKKPTASTRSGNSSTTTTTTTSSTKTPVVSAPAAAAVVPSTKRKVADVNVNGNGKEVTPITEPIDEQAPKRGRLTQIKKREESVDEVRPTLAATASVAAAKKTTSIKSVVDTSKEKLNPDVDAAALFTRMGLQQAIEKAINKHLTVILGQHKELMEKHQTQLNENKEETAKLFTLYNDKLKEAIAERGIEEPTEEEVQMENKTQETKEQPEEQEEGEEEQKSSTAAASKDEGGEVEVEEEVESTTATPMEDNEKEGEEEEEGEVKTEGNGDEEEEEEEADADAAGEDDERKIF